MGSIAAGSIAGLAATAPMTVAMELMHRRLPAHERYALPPRQIAMTLADEAGIAERLDEGQRRALTLLGHFGYGMLAGAVYAPIARRVPGNPALKGAAFGVGVWAASYAGWLPASGIMPPVRRQPARRSLLMLAAHAVWGAATGVIAAGLQKAERGAFARRAGEAGAGREERALCEAARLDPVVAPAPGVMVGAK